ncbi:ribonuclease R [bacterium]|nr:ribonuclease R [bacterium]
MRDEEPGDDVAACLALLEQRAPRPLSIPEMTALLSLDRYDRKRLRAALEAGVAAQRLRRIGKTRYQWRRESARREAAGRPAGARRGRRDASALEGRYLRVRAGFGFVEIAAPAAAARPRDVLIPAGLEGLALHGDRVRIEIVRRDRRSQRATGRVTAVLERRHDEIIGTLERRQQRWFAVPLDERLPVVELSGAPSPRREDAGLVARVRLTPPPRGAAGVRGVLDRVLGPGDDPEVQFLAIAGEHGLRIAFPPAAAAEAERLPEDPRPQDLRARADLRALPFVTIDGETARDFDDAVCLEERPDGGGTLWVAIADVAHYVPPDSALDREAAARGTSVYFPDRAIPMLPARLSSGLCSLQPDRDRLVLAAEMPLDAHGRRRGLTCRRAVIRSRARLTYTQVAAVLSAAETAEIAAWRAQLAPLLPQLRRMRELMLTLRERRVRAGSLDLDLPEALVDLSEEGRSIGVRVAPRNDAHRLIEELMLEANRAVAGWLRDQGIPFPYRIHEPPAPDDVDELNELLAPFGLRIAYDEVVEPADVQQLLDRLAGHRLGRVLSRQVLRALRQARYSTANAGHFGLAFPVYCHFTSPIRRYPDLLVHRQIGRLLDGRVEEARAAAAALEAASAASSQAEREAMEAERAMLDLRKAEFMLGHLLEPEPATVVSVIGAGLFVELDAYPVEGLVRADAIPGDRWTFIDSERALKGLRTGQRFRLGDRVEVEATNVSLQRRQVDFALLRRLPSPDGAPVTPVGGARRPRTPPAGRRSHPGAAKTRRGRRGRRSMRRRLRAGAGWVISGRP